MQSLNSSPCGCCCDRGESSAMARRSNSDNANASQRRQGGKRAGKLRGDKTTIVQVAPTANRSSSFGERQSSSTETSRRANDEGDVQQQTVAPLATRYPPRRARHRRLTPSSLILPLLLLLTLAGSVLASQGDRSSEYQNCVEACKLDSCFVDPKWDDGTARYTKLPLMLRLTAWNCVDDCKYHCTHRVTNEAFDRVSKIREDSWRIVQAEASQQGWSPSDQRRKADELIQLRLASLRPVQKQMVQFHGKWVFIRFLGAQEPMSVLFSILNFQVHFKALPTLRKQISDVYPLKLVYILHTFLCCAAWFWSAVFHTRDKNFTERMDYFAAGGVVLGGWFIAVSRLFRLSPNSSPFQLLAKACGLLFACHVLYLSFGRFNYGYNMKINIFFGLSQSLLWLVYSVKPQLFARFSANMDRYSPARLRTQPASPTIPSTNMLHTNGGSPPVPVSTPLSLPPSSSRKSKGQLQKIILLLLLATCLEIFDFPPIWRSFDAHSLWHAATVPLAGMWYKWLIEDARECTTTGYWIGEGLKFQKSETVENVGKVVGPQVMQAYEKTMQVSRAAREWVEVAAGKSSNAFKDATGTSSGIELKALTNKLNELATETFGRGNVDDVSVSINGHKSNSKHNRKPPTSPPPTDAIHAISNATVNP